MVEECGKRFCKDERGVAQDEEDRAKELVALVNEIFPAPPAKPEDEVDVKPEDEVDVDMKDS